MNERSSKNGVIVSNQPKVSVSFFKARDVGVNPENTVSNVPDLTEPQKPNEVQTDKQAKDCKEVIDAWKNGAKMRIDGKIVDMDIGRFDFCDIPKEYAKGNIPEEYFLKHPEQKPKGITPVSNPALSDNSTVPGFKLTVPSGVLNGGTTQDSAKTTIDINGIKVTLGEKDIQNLQVKAQCKDALESEVQNAKQGGAKAAMTAKTWCTTAEIDHIRQVASLTKNSPSGASQESGQVLSTDAAYSNLTTQTVAAPLSSTNNNIGALRGRVEGSATDSPANAEILKKANEPEANTLKSDSTGATLDQRIIIESSNFYGRVLHDIVLFADKFGGQTYKEGVKPAAKVVKKTAELTADGAAAVGKAAKVAIPATVNYAADQTGSFVSFMLDVTRISEDPEKRAMRYDSKQLRDLHNEFVDKWLSKTHTGHAVGEDNSEAATLGTEATYKAVKAAEQDLKALFRKYGVASPGSHLEPVDIESTYAKDPKRPVLLRRADRTKQEDPSEMSAAMKEDYELKKRLYNFVHISKEEKHVTLGIDLVERDITKDTQATLDAKIGLSTDMQLVLAAYTRAGPHPRDGHISRKTFSSDPAEMAERLRNAAAIVLYLYSHPDADLSGLPRKKEDLIKTLNEAAKK